MSDLILSAINFISSVILSSHMQCCMVRTYMIMIYSYIATYIILCLCVWYVMVFCITDMHQILMRQTSLKHVCIGGCGIVVPVPQEKSNGPTFACSFNRASEIQLVVCCNKPLY